MIINSPLSSKGNDCKGHAAAAGPKNMDDGLQSEAASGSRIKHFPRLNDRSRLEAAAEFFWASGSSRPKGDARYQVRRVAGSVGSRHSRTPATGNESDQEDFDFSPTSHCEFAPRGSGFAPFRPHRHCNLPGAGAISYGRDARWRKMSRIRLPSARRAKRGSIELPIPRRCEQVRC